MRKKLVCILALQVLVVLCVQAQMDSLVLQEVEIYGIPHAKYAVGQKVVEVDSAILQQYQNANLGDLISAVSPVYIKSYGSNMAATISFRGTGASHTGVFWNGLNINSLTLGQTDFSLLPVFSADEINVQYGASSTLYGSDAIGGTIHLSSSPDWNEGTALYLNQGYGSYNTHTTRAALNFSKAKIQLNTKAYYTSSDNDFEYQLPSTKQSFNQNNARYSYYGLTQDVNIRLTSNKYISINGWYNSNERELQPVIGNFSDNTQQRDENLRLTAAYHHNAKYGNMVARTGFINDYQLYDKASEIRSRQYINQLQWDKSFKRIAIRSGVNWKHIKAKADNYDSKKTEDRTDGFVLIEYDLNKIQLTTNIRKTFVTGYSTPLVPSLGIDYKVHKHIKLTGKLSRNYRVPTLNDRYWDPGGNPLIRPELSYNIEGGLGSNFGHFTMNVNYYKMWVTDWIVWVPVSGYSTPLNVKRVNSEGVELMAKWKQAIGKLKMNIQGGYSYNIAMDIDVNQQLPYTPKHNVNANLFVKYKHWNMISSIRYVGQRQTLGSTMLKGYVLSDLEIGRSVGNSKNQLHITVAAKNILNENYQTLLNRAMPGRNYQINLIYQLKNQ
ncbi:MAG TPA: TonB-dependent receptor [Fulvivirga sp.]|nr:TonB-dependent receptor [Fulvivirga sp.]